VGSDHPDPVTVADRVLGQGTVLENSLVRVEVDERGLVVSVVDLLAGRELIAPGAAAGLLQLHRDQPTRWDAWDLDRSYLGLGVDVDDVSGLTVDENGPDAGAITVERHIGRSTIRQTISIRAGRADVRFDTDVEWQEQEKILKLAFPFDVHCDQVAAEIQFGHVRRPTHGNTSWDAARFEHCCHRWVHVAEPGYGVALVNDATYGYDVARSVGPRGTVTTVRPSLVRGARNPDPGADAGRHRFTHVVVPGASVGDAVAAGYAVNLPVRRLLGADRPAPDPLVAVDNDAVVVEAVKLADDRSGDVVVRLYEALGGRALTRLTTAFPLAAAVVVDLLERVDAAHLPDPGLALHRPTGTVSLSLRPFQIVTLRLTPTTVGNG
jgi:alpha-mannosidase